MLDPFLNYLTNRGPAGMLADYYGKAIMPALNAPGKAVRSLVSPGGNEDVFNQAMDYGGRAGSMQGIPGIAMAGGTKLGDEWARYLLDSKGPTQNPALSMFDAMASGNPAADVTGPIGQMIGSTALDPLTYLGSGVTSRAPSIIKTGESLLQSGINKAFLGPALLPKAALGVPLPSFIGNRLTRTVEDPLTDSISQAPAHSVADYLFGGPSRRGLLSQYGDDIKNMTSRLMTGGHNLELDMADLHNARKIGRAHV